MRGKEKFLMRKVKMETNKNLFTKIAITVFFTIASFSFVSAQEASGVITNLYKADKMKSVVTWSDSELKKYFAPGLANAIYKAARRENGIGFDILYNTQDASGIRDFKIGKEDSYHDSNGRTLYTVSATFKKLDKNEEVFFTIDPDSYKIEDIGYYGRDKSLMNLLGNNKPQPNERELKTVTDFYLAMPRNISEIASPDGSSFESDFYFNDNGTNKSDSAIAKYRKSLIKTEDIKNGYLKLESNGWEGWMEIVIFKRVDGHYIVAVTQVGCGPSCIGEIMFLTYSGDKWTNVTNQVFPVTPSSFKGYFRLPRVGTTVELVCGDDSSEDCKKGETLSVFKWNKGKFIK